VKKDIRSIAEQFDCILVYLFGSQAERGRRYLEGEEGKPEAFSDLDVAVAFRNPPAETIRIYVEIYKEISEVLEPFNIDLIFVHEVNPLFQHEIIKGIRVYEKEEHLTDEFEEGVMKRAEDLVFKKRVLDREIMEAIENGYIEFEYSPHP
jgi:predicted nucleotidyltransferase